MRGGRWSLLSATVRVFRQDLFQLLESAQGVVLVLVLPPLLLALVGQLNATAPRFDVLVAGTPAGSSQETVYAEFVALLGDLSAIRVDTAAEAVFDPLEALDTAKVDLLINLEGREPEGWRMYTDVALRPRLLAVRDLAAGLERALYTIDHRAADGVPEEGEDLADETERWITELGAIGSFAPAQLFIYHPRALDRTIDLASGTLVLIVCFIPFVLAVPSVIREKEARTLGVMLAARGVDKRSIFAGKCLFVLGVALAELLLLLVVARWVYWLEPKPGFTLVLALFVPTVLATAFLGVTVSSLAEAQSQIGMAAALYFLATTLLTGFFVPLSESSVVIRALSQLFPITFVMPVFKAWVLGAEPHGAYIPSLGALTAQCVVYGAIAFRAFGGALRRI